MVGDLAVSHQILRACELVWEHRRHEVFRLHPLQRRRDLLATTRPQHRERARRVPTPPGAEHRRVQHRLHQQVLGGLRLQVVEHVVQWEAVLRPERQDDRVLGRRSLELEVEAAAKPLPECEAPRPVDPAPEWRVQHELHPSRFVEEPLEHEGLLGRDDTEDLLGRAQVLDHLARRRLREPRHRAREPGDRGERIVEAVRDVLPQARHLLRQLRRARRRLAQPERNAGRLAVRVHHPHLAGLDLADEIGGVAELEDVARHALDREVLVQGADEGLGRVEDHAIVPDVGDRTAGGERRESGAAPAAQPVVHPVVVDVRAAPAPARGEPLREHLYDVVEILAGEVAVGVGAAHQLVQRRLVPVVGCHSRHDLLGEDVERVAGDDQPVEPALRGRPYEGGALDQLVARQREQPSLRDRLQVMSRPPHALQQRRDRASRANLAHQVHRADVDPELERCRRHQRLELALLEPRLGVEPLLL